MDKLVSLSFAISTLVTQNQIDKIRKEASYFPVGSKYWKAFKNYASYLEKKLQEQKTKDNRYKKDDC